MPLCQCQVFRRGKPRLCIYRVIEHDKDQYAFREFALIQSVRQSTTAEVIETFMEVFETVVALGVFAIG